MQIAYSNEQGERPENLDFFTCFSTRKSIFFILADGYGESTPNGILDYVNQICKTIIYFEDKHSFSKIIQHHPPKNSCMSFLASKITGNHIEICSVGDCRAYLNGQLITVDDTIAWRCLSRRKSFMETASLASVHPMRHTLTDSMKPGRNGEVVAVSKYLKQGDLLFFCTDGAWPLIHDSICRNCLSLEEMTTNGEDNSLVVRIEF